MNLNSNVDAWNIYPLNKVPTLGNQCGKLVPSKYGGLSYTILDYLNSNVAIIQTSNFGKVQIYIGNDVSDKFTITDIPAYKLVN